ncbi:MAG: PA2779 family protein [Desulfobulbaceae bacterium]|nr:PA2779 family protein [Desulfobulbaceae bacterium]
MKNPYSRQLIILLILPCMFLSLTLRPVQAGMIPTAEVVSRAHTEDALAKVTAFLNRQDVQQIMVQQGVDIFEAKERVQVMSDAEIMAMANHIDTLPAGGDALGAVIGAALFIFIVLLITDLLGLTHVFSFVR